MEAAATERSTHWMKFYVGLLAQLICLCQPLLWSSFGPAILAASAEVAGNMGLASLACNNVLPHSLWLVPPVPHNLTDMNSLSPPLLLPSTACMCRPHDPISATPTCPASLPHCRSRSPLVMSRGVRDDAVDDHEALRSHAEQDPSPASTPLAPLEPPCRQKKIHSSQVLVHVAMCRPADDPDA